MDGVALLRAAEDAGLVVRAEGDRLVISGPSRAERVARDLMARKGEIIDVLRDRALYPEHVAEFSAYSEPSPDTPPTRPCYCCGSTRFWKLRSGGQWTCPRCHPPIPSADRIEYETIGGDANG